MLKKLIKEKASEELLLSLDELLDDSEHDREIDDDDDNDTQDWMRLNNRGGHR